MNVRFHCLYIIKILISFDKINGLSTFLNQAVIYHIFYNVLCDVILRDLYEQVDTNLADIQQYICETLVCITTIASCTEFIGGYSQIISIMGYFLYIGDVDSRADN